MFSTHKNWHLFLCLEKGVSRLFRCLSFYEIALDRAPQTRDPNTIFFCHCRALGGDHPIFISPRNRYRKPFKRIHPLNVDKYLFPRERSTQESNTGVDVGVTRKNHVFFLCGRDARPGCERSIVPTIRCWEILDGGRMCFLRT